MRTILEPGQPGSGAVRHQVVDVRIKRVDLPEANMQAIYRRMQTERQRQAAEFRAEGEGASRRIRGTADRQVTVIKADATGESERIRGDGDAEKNRIFAEAFGQDPDFFAFYRSMQAYQAALKSDDTRLLLSPDSQFFQYFNDATGKAEQPGSASAAPPPAKPSERQRAPSDEGRRRSRGPRSMPDAGARAQALGRRHALRGAAGPVRRDGACRRRDERSCRRFRARARHRRVVMGALARVSAASCCEATAGVPERHLALGRRAGGRRGRARHLARARLACEQARRCVLYPADFR